MIRQPIIVVLGHVDHGKTSLLDKIRGTAVQHKEVGGITQQIGATEIPLPTIKKICGKLLNGKDLDIPGLLFIDTPGHEAFTSLRERGGSIADIAVLVVDITAGIQPQTRESIRILQSFKVPFIIALNKVDKVSGWRSNENPSFIESEKKQSKLAKESLQLKIYEIMEQLADKGFDSNIFTQINDYTKTIALVPTSAISGEGISELLMLLTGLSQRYLQKKLEIDISSEGRGTVLEIKEDKGLGKTADVILYDGTIREGDTIIIASEGEPVKTKIKALLKPAPLTEMRQTKKYEHEKSVSAASGIKIMAQNLDGVISGMPIIAGAKNEEEAVKKLRQEVKGITFESDEKGVIIKAESLGSLEAMLKLFKEKSIPVKKAGIGPITKKDILLSISVKEKDEKLGTVFAFNEKSNEEADILASKNNIKIISDPVIYHLLDEYEAWKIELDQKKKREVIDSIPTPARFEIVAGCIFRQSNPCIVGVEVIAGKLKNNVKVMNEEGKIVGTIKGMQKEGENVYEAGRGEQLAISITNAKAGKDVNEGQRFYTEINEKEYKTLIENRELLKGDELEILDKIKEIKQKENKIWGY